MAVDATAVYCRYPEADGLTPEELVGDRCVLMGPNVHMVRSVAESKKLNSLEGPAMLLSSSGMLTGGRVLHHLARLLPQERHMIALIGYQAVGTRGRALQEGARTLRVHRESIPVRAEVVDLGHLSGHADRDELQHWLEKVAPPKGVFVTAGAAGARRWRRHCARSAAGTSCPPARSTGDAVNRRPGCGRGARETGKVRR
jgi:metallo-beta-lactamase family protein